MKPYLLNDVPEDLWEALRTDAASRETPQATKGRRTERSGTSLNNVVLEILAKRYGLEFLPTNRATFDQTPINRSIYLRFTERINAGVEQEAKQSWHGQKRATILTALAEHYLLSLPHGLSKPKRNKRHGRPRGRKARA